MNFLVQAFSEANGNPSSMRLLTAAVVLVILSGWLSVTLNTHAMAPLDLNGPGGILCLALGIKGWQRGRETEKSNEKITP